MLRPTHKVGEVGGKRGGVSDPLLPLPPVLHPRIRSLSGPPPPLRSPSPSLPTLPRILTLSLPLLPPCLQRWTPPLGRELPT